MCGNAFTSLRIVLALQLFLPQSYQGDEYKQAKVFLLYPIGANLGGVIFFKI
jgi:hypothetical protein